LANTSSARLPEALLVLLGLCIMWLQLSAMLLLSHAGEVVELAFLLTNTGNVTLTNLKWDVPSVFVPYGCVLNMQPHNASTTTLLPGSALHCKAYHTVTLEDLEGSEYKVTVLATDQGTGLNTRT
jgi:uncharacterized membrane protein